MDIVTKIAAIIKTPRLLKRLIVVFALLHIVSEQQHLTHTLNVYISLLVAVMWFTYDAHRCEQSKMELFEIERSNRAYLTVSSQVMNLVCNYDPTTTASIQRFQPVIQKSRCLFAKASKIWGNQDYRPGETVQANVERSVPMLLQMLLRGEKEGLDGFLFEARSSHTPGGDFNKDVNKVAAVVRLVLETLSDMDPSGVCSARKSYISDKAWHFSFAGFPIFVTTFAGCYDKTSSRYAYDADPESVFVLLQPEFSFLHHDIPNDTPHTEWERPVTIRDRIRKSFADAGQKYFIPDTVHYPPSEHIVKSLNSHNIIRWWDI